MSRPQTNVMGIACETGDLRSSDQRQRDEAVAQVAKCDRVILGPQHPLEAVRTGTHFSRQEFADTVLVKAVLGEARTPVKQAEMAQRVSEYCRWAGLAMPAPIEKFMRAPVMASAGPQHLTKLQTAKRVRKLLDAQDREVVELRRRIAALRRRFT